MAAQIVSLLRFAQPQPRDWSQQELAEFYRVEGALLRAGMRIETERGVSDDGDPWFAFCRAEDGEVFIHFARIDGEYLIAGPGYEGIARGRDFSSLVRDLISRHPLVQPATGRGPGSSSNIFLHPAALLIAVVATAFFKTNEAKADDGDPRHDHKHARAGLQVAARSVSGQGVVTVDADQTLAVVASAMIALDREGSLLSATSLQALGPQNHKVQPDLFAAGAAELTAQLPAGPALSAPEANHATSSFLNNAGAWLALTVVLHDLATGSPTGAPTEDAGLPTAVLGPHGPAMPESGPAPAPAADTGIGGASLTTGRLFAVELNPGPLPDVTAIRVLHESGVDTGAIIQVAKLPNVLADYIARGEHLPESQFRPQTTLPQQDAVPQPTADGGDAALPAGQAPAPATAGATHDGAPENASPQGDAPQGATPPVEGPRPPTGITVSSQSIADVVAYFASHTGHISTVVNGNHAVMYDDLIMTNIDALNSAKSLTFNFDDGSSISLVGSAVALPEFHGLH